MPPPLIEGNGQRPLAVKTKVIFSQIPRSSSLPAGARLHVR